MRAGVKCACRAGLSLALLENVASIIVPLMPQSDIALRLPHNVQRNPWMLTMGIYWLE